MALKLFKLSALFISFSSSLNLEKHQDSCKVLVLGGGGSKGAFEVGALQAMIETLPEKDVQYDVFAGVSIGGLTAFLLSLWPKGFEQEAVNRMTYHIFNKAPKDLYDWLPWWQYVLGMMFSKGVFDQEPLRKIIRQEVKLREIERGLVVSALDLNSGKIVTFDETMDKSIMEEVFIGAASVPIGFQPTKVKGSRMTLVDAGVYQNLNVASAINKCRSKGIQDSKITVDIITCYLDPLTIKYSKIEQVMLDKIFNTWDRRQEIDKFYFQMQDVTREARAYPNVNFRWLVQPEQKLPGNSYFSVFTDLKDMKKTYNLGYKNAKKVLTQTKEGEKF